MGVNFLFHYVQYPYMHLNKKKLSEEAEDFLLMLFQLSEHGFSDFGVTELAQRTGVSKAAVSRMARTLAEKGMLLKKRYSRISLSLKGRKMGREIARKRRIIEVFLNKSLGLKGRSLELQAHTLEHSISLLTAKKLHEFLGRPRKCPHGKSIMV